MDDLLKNLKNYDNKWLKVAPENPYFILPNFLDHLHHGRWPTDEKLKDDFADFERDTDLILE